MEAGSVWAMRLTLLLYSIGLWHAFVTVIRQRHEIFRPALIAIAVGSVSHLAAIVMQGFAQNQAPVQSLHQMASLAGFLITWSFLVVYWRYKYDSLAAFVFPTIFLLTLVGALGGPVEPWAGEGMRTWWLSLHVGLFLLGYAALSLTFVAGVMYLIQERELKSKRPRGFSDRLPPLRKLDEMASQTLAVGFVMVTLGLVAASFYAFVEWGASWIVDPTIALAFLTWAIYVAMLFSRMVVGWRGRKGAYFAIAGFFCAALTWIVNNGVHSFMQR